MTTQKVYIPIRRLGLFLMFLLVIYGCKPAQPEKIRNFSSRMELQVLPAPNETVVGEQNTVSKNTHAADVRISAEFNYHEVFKYLMGAKYGKNPYDEGKDIYPPKQSSLYVDEHIVSDKLLLVYGLGSLVKITDQSGKVYFRGSGYLKMEWKVPLTPGEHTAKFRVTKEGGKEALEYTWSYTVTENK